MVPPIVGEDGGLWRRQLESTGVRVLEGSAGVVLSFPDGVRLKVLHPPLPPLEGTGADVNNNSLVVQVSYQGASALYPGDLEAEGEWALLDSGAWAQGPGPQTGPPREQYVFHREFLRTVAPTLVAVSVGEGNPFNHPSPEVLDRVRQLAPDYQIYSTAIHGDVHLTTDGVRWWAKTSR